MIVSRIAGGLPAASFALLLLVVPAPAAAVSAMGKAPWWAAGPVPVAMPIGGAQRLVPAPFIANQRDAWRAAQAYRWRPIEAPSRRAPMRATWSPPVPWAAMPVRPVQAWGPVPPRVAAWRAPTIVTVDGTPYRFRPVAPWSGRAVAQVGRWPGPVGYPGHAPFRPPQPTQVASWPGPDSLAFAPARIQQWAQPPAFAPAHTWQGYRFRPDARFAVRGPPPGGPDSWSGPPAALESGLRLPGGDLRAAPAPSVEPPVLWGRTVAYQYE
jgi:hypothetical protein